MNKEIELQRVFLTRNERTLIESHICSARNMLRACKYAKIHHSTLKKAIGGSPLRVKQRNRLLEYITLPLKKR